MLCLPLDPRCGKRGCTGPRTLIACDFRGFLVNRFLARRAIHRTLKVPRLCEFKEGAVLSFSSARLSTRSFRLGIQCTVRGYQPREGWSYVCLSLRERHDMLDAESLNLYTNEARAGSGIPCFLSTSVSKWAKAAVGETCDKPPHAQHNQSLGRCRETRRRLPRETAGELSTVIQTNKHVATLFCRS